MAPTAACSEWTQRDLRLGLFCSSQGPFSVLVGSLLDNLTKQRRVLVTSCRLYRQLPTKTEMDQSGLTGLSVPDLVPLEHQLTPRISARVATEVFFNLGPREA